MFSHVTSINLKKSFLNIITGKNMATVQPIAPQDVVDKKLENIPNAVIESFNELIAKKFNGSQSTIKQDEIVKHILSKDGSINRQDIFDNHWLDVEEMYRKIGWDVEFDKPGYNESYEAFFVFKKKK